MPLRDTTGHRSIVGLLARAADRDTLPPSLIFAGPEGVGKHTVAVALAEVLNCLSPLTGEAADGLAVDACGACDACARIARGVHADVLRIEPGESGSIRIEQARDAIDRAGYRPFEGRRRVVIVDEADALVPEAQHALLKTLEEPPPSSVFVLVTARPDMLLPTVRSRCPRLRFGRLSPREVADVLVRRHEYSEPDARQAAAAADGSPGAALAAGTGELVEARVAASRILQDVARGDAKRRLDGARELAGKAAGREELALRLYALASLVRDLGLLVSRADATMLANADLQQELQGLQATFNGNRVIRAFSAVDRALRALERNASPKVVADWLAFQL